MEKPYKVQVTVCGTNAGAYDFATLKEARADMESRKKLEVLGCYYRIEGPCPKCNGVPEQPEIEGCKGCIGCDFKGTVAGFDDVERIMREAYEAETEMRKEHAEYVKRGLCSQCGARNIDEAGDKCSATSGITGDYSCAGDDLWPETE